jgi:peptidoglycan/xylan/chitin deacetylase (PgdA/CDA1 family)
MKSMHADAPSSPPGNGHEIGITLTFDNGPCPEVTPGVLDVLRDRGLPATFFVVGERLLEHRSLAERAVAEGHWIGNHTLTHSRPLGELGEGARREISATQEALGALAHPDRYFRPMGGGGNLDSRLLSPAAVDTLVSGGYSCVLWNAVPGDWKDPEGWVERALAQCAAQDRTLLVLHDVPGGALARLETFLDAAAERGLRFRQDLPRGCMPIRRGVIERDLTGFVAAA